MVLTVRMLRVFVGVAIIVGLFAATTGNALAKKCLRAPEVALMVDDSASMQTNDRPQIRVQALRLLLEKPSSQPMTLGAIEFGSKGGPLFKPGKVSEDRDRMFSSLGKLNTDGFAGLGVGTSYNSAFKASRRLQPHPDARIFLTDGESGDRKVRVGLAKGAPTFVIGLNIGPTRSGSDARMLNRIARISGGSYFPLRKGRGFSQRDQLTRLQPVINRIASKLGCSRITKTFRVDARRKGQKFGPYGVNFGRHKTIQIQATWAVPSTSIVFTSCRAISRSGQVVADLKGNGKRTRLQVRVISNKANKLLIVKRPPRGVKLVFTFKVVRIKRKTPIVVQIEQGGGGSVFEPGSGDGGETPSDPPTPTSYVITVDNRVTNGMAMREDSTPARLTSQPWTFCTSRGCNINGTERSSGQTYDAAVCQTSGERTTNGNDHSSVDDGNPSRFESTRYYGVRLSNGTFGFISEVWIASQHRGGLGLPPC